MTHHDDMRIDLDDILGRLEANGYDDVRVEFVPGRPSGLSFVSAMDRAFRVANREVPDIEGQSPTVTVAGASVRLEYLTGQDVLAAWLAVFARELRAGGLSGVIHATPMVRLPGWFFQMTEPRLTAYVAYDGTFVDDAPPTGQESPTGPCAPAVASWLERAVSWAAGSGGEALLASGGFYQSAPVDGIASHLCSALRARPIASLTYLDAQPGRATHIALNVNGHAIYQTHDSGSSSIVQAHRIREGLLTNGEQTRLAFAAMTPVWAYSWDTRGRALPPLPTIPPYALRDNATVWSQYVPDAHGMQVLTEEHMRHVSDLSAWEITPVGSGHYLVEARDLTEWFRPGGPAEPVVTQARADFGRAIIAADALT